MKKKDKKKFENTVEKTVDTSPEPSDEVSQVQTDRIEKGIYDFCEKKLNEVGVVAGILGFSATISDLENSLPALFISAGLDIHNEGRVMTCIPMPVVLGQIPCAIIEITTIVASIKKENTEQIKKLAEKLNSSFSFGTFLVYEDEMSFRYSICARPDSNIDQLMLAKCFEIIIQETNHAMRLVDDITKSNKSVEEVDVYPFFS